MTQAESFKADVKEWILSQAADSRLAANHVHRFEDLYDALKEGIVHFWFRKRDGSLRSAYGTLDMEIVARHGGVPEGKERETAFLGAVSYYDLEKDAWRAFRADSIQEIDFGYGAL